MDIVCSKLNIDEEFRSLIPPLAAMEYAELEASILDEGCRDSLVVLGDTNTILDGHNRYEICNRHRIGFKVSYKEFADRNDAKIWIIRNQFGRRNLNLHQRSKLALELKPLIAQQAKEKQIEAGKAKLLQNSGEAIRTDKELAKAANVSHDTISKVEKIEAKAEPEQKEALRTGEVSVNKIYRDVVKKERDIKEAQAKAEMIPQLLPTGKYKTIVIDPPWETQKIIRDVAPNQKEFDYPTMTYQEIIDVPVADLADDDCHLFLWTTQKHLLKAVEILDKWGFRYILTMGWHKSGGFQPFGLPQYNLEFILYGRKGSPKFVDTKNFPCCFEGKRREHSRKPDEFYDTIRRVTDEPRIDYFSRERRDGFDQYGNEADKFSA